MLLNLSIDKNFKDNLDLRKKKLSEFKEKGFPNKNTEEWKFTDMNSILNNNFKQLENYESNKEKKFNLPKLDFEYNLLTLFNGGLYSNDFKYEDTKAVEIKKLNSKNFKDFLQNKHENIMLKLNSALCDRGYSLNVKSNYIFKKPLVILNYYGGKLKEKIINNSEIINICSNSKLNIIEIIIDDAQTKFVKNTYKFRKINENSILDHHLINQNKSVGFFYDFCELFISRNANYNCNIFSSGIKFLKKDIEANLLGENCECKINSGLYLNSSSHQEIKTQINHMKPNCKSYQKIKKALTSESKGIFQGKIFVKDIAQKTNAYQLSKGLIIDEGSEFNTKPELEIYADDVKGSHGSTSGNLDEEALYYLRARGIPKKYAARMIIKGFLENTYEHIQNQDILKIINRHFENNLNYEN